MMSDQSKVITTMHKMLEVVINRDGMNKFHSFSDIVKKNSEVIVVKPINMKQKCQETKKEVKTKIDPVKLAVGVKTITNIIKDGVAIACSSNESKEKLKNCVQ
ncbi:hypothetical protein QE152_g24374 [Popillia japonica]|uniref:Uncharacterized protein n=1 Tax=Popillia japonica TaxID=7064 RepID=A0AAW1KEZ4_POPJA